MCTSAWYDMSISYWTWWRHQMEIFSALLALYAGNSPVPGEFPTQRPVTRSFDVYFDLRPNRRLSKQSRGWWFETASCPLWRHRNESNSNLPWWILVMFNHIQGHFNGHNSNNIELIGLFTKMLMRSGLSTVVLKPMTFACFVAKKPELRCLNFYHPVIW